MTTLSHEAVSQKPLAIRAMWASFAIAAMWLAVLFDAIFGPDIKSIDVAGNTTSVPSAVAMALFAAIGTVAVALRGFGRES